MDASSLTRLTSTILLVVCFQCMNRVSAQDGGGTGEGVTLASNLWTAENMTGGPAPATYPSTSINKETWGCDACCRTTCNMCPCIYGSVEGLIWDRNSQSSNVPLVLDVNTGDTLLSTGDLDFGVGGGVRAIVGHYLTDCVSLELGYFGIFDQVASASVVRADSLQIAGALGSGAVNNFIFADQVDVDYQSNVHNAEINLVHCCCCCDSDSCCYSIEPLIGFRNLNLNERFSLTSIDSAEGTTVYTVRTHNYLFGAHAGGRYRRCYGNWSWETTAKAGLMGNISSMNQDPIVDFPGVVVRPRRDASDDDAAFVGDINLTGIYHLSRVWGLRAGYNLLWVQGVALAPDQLDFTNTPTSGTALFNHSGLFMHGVSLGVEARW